MFSFKHEVSLSNLEEHPIHQYISSGENVAHLRAIQMLKNMDRVTDHLTAIAPRFYGRIVIKVRDGKAVMITEERDTRLDDETKNEEKS